MTTRIYCIRSGRYSQQLVEFDTVKEMRDTAEAWAPDFTFRRVPAATAHDWVRKGRTHMTGLWLDDGRIRYAPADPEGN